MHLSKLWDIASLFAPTGQSRAEVVDQCFCFRFLKSRISTDVRLWIFRDSPKTVEERLDFEFFDLHVAEKTQNKPKSI